MLKGKRNLRRLRQRHTNRTILPIQRRAHARQQHHPTRLDHQPNRCHRADFGRLGCIPIWRDSADHTGQFERVRRPGNSVFLAGVAVESVADDAECYAGFD